MFENPSAGKFDPPPPPSEPSTSRFRPRRVIAILLLALLYPFVRRWEKGLDYPLARTAIDLGLLAVTTGMHFIFNYSRPDGNDDPYSPPTRITR